jgi:FkbM family methyltransferase
MHRSPPENLARLWRLRGRIGPFARQTLRATEIAQGWRGELRAIQVAFTGQLSGRGRGPDAPPTPVSMKELGGKELFVRPGTSDLVNAAGDYLDRIHLPPLEIAPATIRQIVELGSNTGSAMASFAVRYPQARILGVEPDPRNAAVARRNVARFGGRCELVQAAIWDQVTELIVEGDQAFGYTVRPGRQDDPPEATRVPTTTIDALLDRHMPTGEIDYLYMTIEGAESRVLRPGGRWIDRVRCIRLDWGRGGDPCRRELECRGFETRLEAEGAGVWTVGIRR